MSYFRLQSATKYECTEILLVYQKNVVSSLNESLSDINISSENNKLFFIYLSFDKKWKNTVKRLTLSKKSLLFSIYSWYLAMKSVFVSQFDDDIWFLQSNLDISMLKIENISTTINSAFC